MNIKRAMVILVGICGLSAGLAAQSGMDQKDKPMMMKPGEMMVSGCVAAGTESGHYMLTHAMVAKMDKDSKMAKPAMAGEPMMSMSYDLVGGDLKAHVGHKVEVTGTMSKADMARMDDMAKMDAMAKDKMAKDKDMKAMNMKLNVVSVKMISATCG